MHANFYVPSYFARISEMILLLTFLLAMIAVEHVPAFSDDVVGELTTSRNNFPFLSLADYPDMILVFPNLEQTRQLQKNSGDKEDNEKRNIAFGRFLTFQKFLGDFLKIEYRLGEAVIIPKVNIKQNEYQLTVLILPAHKLKEFADGVVVKNLESRGVDETSLPVQQIVNDIKTCEFEKVGKTGTSEFQSIGSGYTGFCRYRINCFGMKEKVFVAIGIQRIVYESSLQDVGPHTLQDLMVKHTDYKLGEHVQKLYLHYITNELLEVNHAECKWFGTAPFCNGECDAEYSSLYEEDSSGDGQPCWSGNKVRCCKPKL